MDHQRVAAALRELFAAAGTHTQEHHSEIILRVLEALPQDLTNELQWEVIRLRMAGFDKLAAKVSDQELGATLREYVHESAHGSWEGFGFAELIGISAFLEDMTLAHEHGLLSSSQPEGQ